MKFRTHLSAAGILVFALTLGGCFGNTVDMSISDEAKQRCPAVGIVGGAGQVVMFREGSEGYVSDIRYRGTIGGLAMQCEDVDGGVRANIIFTVSATKGEAGEANSVTFPYFVAVTRGSEDVLSRQIYRSSHAFPAGEDDSFSREVITAFVPETEPEGPLKPYEILIGFQLSREQLEYNVLR